MRRARYYLPFEDELNTTRGRLITASLMLAIDEIDTLMHTYYGIPYDDTKERMYRLLGWMAASARMEWSGGAPHDVSRGSAESTG